MNKCFENLVAEFCMAVNLPCPKEMMNGVAFTINHVTFSVHHQRKAKNDLLFIYADFGRAPKKNARTCYYHLLQENFLDFPVKDASFGVVSATRNVVHVSSYCLDTITADDLVETVVGLAWQAELWRIDNLSGDRNTAPGVAANRAGFMTFSAH
ncbi:MAG: hypothetical protein A3I66_21140 [Burkholderiales bacterium RIFCSPLOWO2_02_FULL_57_36]|nr:MAG: hypothetical protein A3I66_21140 [Burkholderiales bacterium RIFCSPLOWO2_02_FULL_57_36]